MLNTISPNQFKDHKLLEQAKHPSESDAARFAECYKTGVISDYMKKSSQFDKLYDFIDIEDKKLFSVEGKNFIIAKEKPTHNNWPAFRIFSVNEKGEKSIMASILDYFGNGYTIYNNNGNIIYEKSYVRDLPIARVFDNTMKGYTADMNELERIKDFDFMTNDAKISKLNTKGQFTTWHADFLDNFGRFLSKMTKYFTLDGNTPSKDVFLNADKYTTFEDVTLSTLKSSELLETSKFSIHNNLLEINTPRITGTVPLFDKIFPSIKEDSSNLHVHFHRFFGSGIFNEQDSQFLKALSRYLTELNKISTTKFNYLDFIQTLIK